MATISIARDEHVFVLTGAGISAESGLPTFRASDGLWEGHRIEDVCTPEAWQTESGAGVGVLFCAKSAGAKAEPNPAHFALAELEARLGARFFLCTQNVDDLHERAGSVRLVHMHGELAKARCSWECGSPPVEDRSVYANLDEVGRCACGGRLRPHIVFFGEIPLEMDRIRGRNSEGDADGCRGNFRVGLSRGQLCALGAAARGANCLCRAGGAAECCRVYACGGGQSRGNFAWAFSDGVKRFADVYEAAMLCEDSQHEIADIES